MSDSLAVRVSHRFVSGFHLDLQFQLPLHPSTVTAVTGMSGSGKSTLLRILAGLQSVQDGRVQFGPETWVDTARHLELPPQARRVGMVFQHPALFPHLTVAQNITCGIARLPQHLRNDRLAALLGQFDLHHLREQRPGQLSGGQLQRVALARCLAPQPQLLLLDEPLSALDLPSRGLVRQTLKRHLAQSPVTTLLVTHDPNEIRDLATAVIVIDQGRVLQQGPLADVLLNPIEPLVAELLAAGQPAATPPKSQSSPFPSVDR
jgi:molybdate transport system ATP-binding protein